MDNSITLRGYALPWREIAMCGSRREYFEVNAINPETNGPVFLNYGAHSAPAISRALSLFSDPYGLGFTARVSWESWRGMSGVTRDVITSRLTACTRNMRMYVLIAAKSAHALYELQSII